MARKKATTPQKRSNEGSGSASSTKKSKKSSYVLRRRILPTPPEGVHLLGPIHLEWKNPEERSAPKQLQITETDSGSLEITADETPLQLSDVTAELVRKYSRLPLVLDTLTSSELRLNLAIKIMPMPNARMIVEILYSKDYSAYDEGHELNDTAWREFFKELEGMQRSRYSLSENYQHENLQPTLRGYQSAAVGWMIQRECEPGHLNLSWLKDVADDLDTQNGNTILYNKYSGSLYDVIPPTPTCSGGILADEMGLGKTVITLALILNHTRSDFNDWELTENPLIEKVDDSIVVENNGPSQRELNQETCLDASEKLQLVPNNLGGKKLRKKLEEWYESKLAEVKFRPVVERRRRRLPFKCTCGDDVETIPRLAVSCQSCGLMQHRECVGYQSDQLYICPACWRFQSPIPSCATLIIVPPAIFSQWASEVERHAPYLQVLPYSGVRDKFVQPSHMAGFDVVITTYTVLRTEILFTTDTAERRLRNEGRFLRTSSPLEKVNWWRIVCDEAQMVESDASQIRIMTNRLSGEHRWCVTGTPIQKGVADLFYLTSFMGLGVFDDKKTWSDFLLRPYLAGFKEPLLSVLHQVFWRSTKEEVSAELGLPEQTFQRHLLKFSAIEETFYMQQHSLSASKFAEGLRKSGLDVELQLDSLNKGTLNRLLQPLLNIRQACTHPQVVSGISISSASGAATLAELLQYLCKKTKQECDEALRRHIAALNGLAGLNCLIASWAEAMENYRSVLRLAEECRDGIQVDTLQRIHALTNAALVLEQHTECAPPTLRDERLREDALQLEKKYLSKPEEAFSSSYAQAAASSKEVVAIRNDFESSPSAWWVPVILVLKDVEGELIDKLAEDLHSNDPAEKFAAKYFLGKIQTIRGVEVTIKQWWTTLEKNHSAATEAMSVLGAIPCNTLVDQALNCHLRASEQKERCELCCVERALQDLECELFATSRKSLKTRERVIDGAETKGSWKAHSAERTLFATFNFARTRCSLEAWCLRDGRQHVRLLEAMKKEFKHLRASWTALNHRVHAEDELTMAKLRLRLAEPWETQHRPDILALSAPVKADTIHHVPPNELPVMMDELAADRDAALSDFRKKQGRLLYLQNLGKSRNATPEPCPVCKNALEQQWCVLHCGHCFCIECLQMIHTGVARRVKCPVCREFTDTADVGFVDTSGTGEVSDIEVKGDFSTKVDSIVREVLRLLQQDPAVKILIFSTWAEVLKILSQALAANQVSYVALPSGKHQLVIESFRNQSGGVSVLLLPLAWGSKGLNLIEATHVFLVEPILNPSEELQAIGRVHRIGQTRPTVVHRFIIKGTVEEKIFEVVSEAKDTWSNKKASLADLQRLFIIPDRQNGRME